MNMILNLHPDFIKLLYDRRISEPEFCLLFLDPCKLVYSWLVAETLLDQGVSFINSGIPWGNAHDQIVC